jgi:hypothetical protein
MSRSLMDVPVPSWTSLMEYHAKCHQQLLDVTQLVRMDLTKLQRVSLGALVTLDVLGGRVVRGAPSTW